MPHSAQSRKSFAKGLLRALLEQLQEQDSLPKRTQEAFQRRWH